MNERKSLRETDAMIASEVMGWGLFDSYGETFACTNRFCKHDPESPCRKPGYVQGCGDVLMHKGRHFGFFAPGWSPSTDIAAAWQVVEKLIDLGHYCVTPAFYKGSCVCSIEDENTVTIATCEAPTAPLAICLAALKAFGIEVEVTL